MKAKYLLFSLALSAGFAACTSEFEQFETSVNQGQVALEDRATGKVVLGATRGGDSEETRIVAGKHDPELGTFNWFWEEGDMLGGVMVDALGRGEIHGAEGVGDYGFTNHPYESDVEGTSDKANFTSNTVVTEGVYVFYNAFEKNKTGRGPIKNVLDDEIRIVAGATEDTGLAQIGTNDDKGGQNLFISPAVDMSLEWTDGKSENYVPIQMQSVYHVLQLKLVAAVGDYIEGFGINKIVVTPENDAQFKKEFILNPYKLAEVAKKVQGNYDTEEPKKEWIAPNGAIKTAGIYGNSAKSALVRGVMEDVAEAMTRAYDMNASGTTCEKLVYYFDEIEKFENTTDPKFIQVLIPGGNHGELTVDVYTTEGVWSKTFEVKQKTEGGTILRNAGEYRYGNSTMMTGTMTIGTGAATDINKYDYTEGFVIETSTDYDFALEYIAEHHTDFGTGKTPKFLLKNSKPLELSEFPAYKAEFYAKEAGATIKLTDDLTFDPTKTIFDASETPVLQVADSKTLTINSNISIDLNVEGEVVEGVTKGTVKVVNSQSNAVTVDFEGMNIETLDITGMSNVNINSDATVANLTVTDPATLKVTGDATLTEATLAGVATFQGDLATGDDEVAKNVNISKATTVVGTWNNYANVDVAAAVAAGTLVNGGTISVNEGSLTASTINNNTGKNITVAMGAELEVNTFNNKGIFTLDGGDATSEGASVANVNTKMTNGGIVNIEAAVSNYKTAVGGDMYIKSLTNNAGADVNNNGQLEVISGTNKGVITLGESDWAQIILPNMGTTGIVRLAAAEAYPAPAGTTLANSIDPANVVYAAFDAQAAYNKVTVTDGVNGAWNTIDIVEIAGTIDIAAGDVTGSSKQYFLLDNGVVSLSKNALLPNLTANGSNSAVQVATTGKKYSLTIEQNVTVNGNMAVNEGVTVMLPASAEDNKVLLVNGTLKNSGSINTAVITSLLETPIWSEIGLSGKLVNEGKMAEADDVLIGSDEKEELIDKFAPYITTASGKNFGSSKETYNLKKGASYPIEYVEYSSNVTTSTSWGSCTRRSSTMTYAELVAFLYGANGKSFPKQVRIENKWNALVQGNVAIYFGEDESVAESNSDAKTFLNDVIKNAVKVEGQTYYVGNVLFGITDSPAQGTVFQIVNRGTLDLSFSANPANKGKAWAYGYSTQSTGATKKGTFQNEETAN